MNFNEIAQIARNLIGDHGAKAVLRIPQGQPVYDPKTNTYSAPEILYNGYAVIANYENSLIDGSVIQKGDRLVKAILDGEPKAGLSTLDIYNNEGVKIDSYQIINVLPVNPNGSITIMYTLQCRK